MKEIAEVLSDYDLGKILNILPAKNGARNRTYIIESEKGKFFLKEKNPLLTNTESFFHEYDIVQHLLNRGFKTAGIITNKRGDTFKRKGNLLYRLYEYIDGKRYTGTEQDDAKVARMLAEYHKIMGSFKGPAPREDDYAQWVSGNFQRLKKKLNKNDFSELSRIIDETTLKLTSLSNQLPCSVIHGDVHQFNITFRKGVPYLFDFDEIRMESRVGDLANTLIYFTCLDYKKIDFGDLLTFLQKCSPNMNNTEKFLKEYSAIYPLSRTEKKALPLYLVLVWLGWLLWTLANVKCDYGKEINKSMFFVKETERLGERISDLA